MFEVNHEIQLTALELDLISFLGRYLFWHVHNREVSYPILGLGATQVGETGRTYVEVPETFCVVSIFSPGVLLKAWPCFISGSQWGKWGKPEALRPGEVATTGGQRFSEDHEELEKGCLGRLAPWTHRRGQKGLAWAGLVGLWVGLRWVTRLVRDCFCLLAPDHE